MQLPEENTATKAEARDAMQMAKELYQKAETERGEMAARRMR